MEFCKNDSPLISIVFFAGGVAPGGRRNFRAEQEVVSCAVSAGKRSL